MAYCSKRRNDYANQSSPYRRDTLAIYALHQSVDQRLIRRGIRLGVTRLIASLIVSPCLPAFFLLACSFQDNGARPAAQEEAAQPTAALTITPPESVPTPSPTPSVPRLTSITAPIVSYHPHFPCGPLRGPPVVRRPVFFWTPDGSSVLFSHGRSIWKVDGEGFRAQMVLNANPGSSSLGPHRFEYGLHADLSPDGAQLVYTSCQFFTEYEWDDAERRDQIGREWYERGKFHYEIAVSGLDGRNVQRLTHNIGLDHFPAWSPGGNRIAYMSNTADGPGIRWRARHLLTMSANGSDVQQIDSEHLDLALYPPVWSPNGKRLAFLVYEGKVYPGDQLGLYTVRHDGRDLVRVGETTVAPTWSPDSKRLALVRSTEEREAIYIMQVDGTVLQRIAVSIPEDSLRPITQVLWSPRESEVLFAADRIYAVKLDGKEQRRLTSIGSHGQIAAWSPDGSRVAVYYPAAPVGTSVAVYYPGGRVLSMTREGRDVRTLAEGNTRGEFRATTSPRADAPV